MITKRELLPEKLQVEHFLICGFILPLAHFSHIVDMCVWFLFPFINSSSFKTVWNSTMKHELLAGERESWWNEIKTPSQFSLEFYSLERLVAFLTAERSCEVPWNSAANIMEILILLCFHRNKFACSKMRNGVEGKVLLQNPTVKLLEGV